MHHRILIQRTLIYAIFIIILLLAAEGITRTLKSGYYRSILSYDEDIVWRYQLNLAIKEDLYNFDFVSTSLFSTDNQHYILEEYLEE